MAADATRRKLTAILSADVEGYSRLMREDELETVAALSDSQRLITGIVAAHRGRVVDAPGDNLLAEFASVVDAVSAAVAIQRRLAERNAGLDPRREMRFRIGINLGDVLEDGGRIFGDGVNVAARIEGLAEGGGICVAHSVYEQVRHKLPQRFEPLGACRLKNIAEPVHVWRLVLPAAGRRPPAAPAGAATETEKPSIAVLPFANMSGDPEQEYFSDGITEDLITDLAKLSGLLVIARNSTFAYKGRAVRVDELGRELGVRYVLEGSVRKAGERVRITAQLIDARNAGHLWAERYDRRLDDIFALQDEVVAKIVAALAPRLSAEERRRLEHRGTDSLPAYDRLLQGMAYCNRQTAEANRRARRLFAAALELDPGYASARVGVGRTLWLDWVMGWDVDPGLLERAGRMAAEAIGLEPSLSAGHELLGDVLLWRKRHEEAIEAQQKAIELSPGDADALASLGGTLPWAGQPEGTAALVRRAMRLNPHFPAWYPWNLGHAAFLEGRTEEAAGHFQVALNGNPDYLPAHLYLAVLHEEQGRRPEARRCVGEVRRLSPHFLEALRWERIPYRDRAIFDRVVGALRRAAQD